MIRSLNVLCLAVPLAAAAAPAHAQDTLRLTLAEAQRIAAENNPQYRRVLTEVGTAEADLRRARGAWLPSVAFTMRASGGYSRRTTGVDRFGETVESPDPIESNSSRTDQSISVGPVTLLDGGRRRRDLRAAQSGFSVTQARVSSESLRVRGEVQRRYWEAVRMQMAIRLEEELLRSARDRLEATRALMRVGVRGPLDVLSSEVTVAEQEQALTRARGEARRTQLDLRQSLGVVDGPPLAFTDSPPDLLDPALLNADALVARALADHPRMARVAAAEGQAEHRLASSRAARWPRLGLTFSMGRNQDFGDYSGLLAPNPSNQAATVGFDLSVPLFSQYTTTYQIQSSRAARDAAREDARAERLTLERDVRAGVLEVQNAHAAALHATRTLELNRRRLELAQQQYRVGALTVNDLTDAVERAARAERDALRTRFEFAAALTTLEERVGGPVVP